jgi:hypothetical protein
MPTVLRSAGLRAVIYPNDHRPAHVHIIGKGCEAVFNLHCPDGPAELRENYGFSLKDLNRITAVLVANLAATCREWERLHGDP